MAETGNVNDVVFRQPQIISEVETIFPGPGGGATSARAQSGAMELGRRLLLAARAGDTSLVLDLMAKGAPFTNDWLGTSPLHLAASNAHTETCGVLLRAGVSRESRTKVERTPLHLAAYAGHAEVAELLLEHGAQVDCRDMLRMTPLHWAAERGHTQCAAVLLRHGADIKAVNKFRKTPTQLAAAAGHAEVLALIDEELKLRENDKSVRALMAERPTEETPASESQRPTGIFTVHTQRNIQEVKTKPKPVQEKTANPDVKAEKIEAAPAGEGSEGSEGSKGSEGAAALLRRHGIALLPPDHSSTVLNALQHGRTVVLSDAGKLMLKESEEPTSPPTTRVVTPTPVSTPTASSNVRSSRGMVLTATPVRTTPLGVKVFTVNNRLSVTPSEARSRAKIMSPQDLQQVKIVQLPPDARIVSPRRAPRRLRVSPAPTGAGSGSGARAPVKIIMNKANFERLVAGAKQDGADNIIASANAVTASAPITVTQNVTISEAQNASSGTSASASHSDAEARTLRALLAQAQATVAALQGELRDCRARLAHYEQADR